MTRLGSNLNLAGLTSPVVYAQQAKAISLD